MCGSMVDIQSPTTDIRRGKGLKRAERGSLQMQDAKNRQKTRHLRTIVQLCRATSSQLRQISTIGKKLVK